MRKSAKAITRAKKQGTPLVALTCYDVTFAKLIEPAGVDILLVGDSLGMVIKGEKNTLNVSIDDVIYHTKAVTKFDGTAHIVADMPFLSYHASINETIKNAGRLLQAGAQSVKLEGGTEIAKPVKKLVERGIPVMAHIGLCPQKIHKMGGFVIQGLDTLAKEHLLQEALAVQDAGAYALVLEGVEASAVAHITKHLHIPTIGIGAGAGCDGQILVIYDLLRLNPDFAPRFVKSYLDGATLITQACRNFADDVRSGRFPGPEHAFLRKAAPKCIENVEQEQKNSA